MYAQRSRNRAAAAVAATLTMAVAAGASANTRVDAKMTDPMEQSITFITQGNGTQWHIAQVAQNGLFYKGMDVTCNKVMSNADVNNRFVQTPTWLGDPDTANAYAIRSTAKALLKKQVVLIDQLDQYDPNEATIAEFKAVRPLRLLVLMDKQNIDNLLAAIKGAIDKKLATGIGAYILSEQWHDEIDLETDDKVYDLLRELSKNRTAVDAFIRGNGAQPLGMTLEEMNFMAGNLMAKGWDKDQAERRVIKRNQREAFRIVDDLIAMQRETFVVRFATGYKMGWAVQKAVLGDYRVAKRNLTNVNDFPNGAYDLYYPNTNWAPTPIGPGADDLDRISLMNRDLELMDIVKKYVNVDGYWAPEVPSLWHRNSRFHSEAALIYPAAAVEFTGQCMAPFKTHEEPVEED